MPSKKDYSEDAKNLFFNEKNKKKLEELKEKYGMQYIEEKEDAPPEIVNNFLNYVEEFEEAWKKAEKKKVIEILGFPRFRKADELKSRELDTEIDKVLAKYAEHNIYIDVIEEDDVSDEAFYKFLTEELPEHEADFMQVEGMNTNYIYEEFHPNNKLDAKDIIEWFSYSLSKRDKEGIKTYLSKDSLFFNGSKKSLPEFIEEMMKLISGYESEVNCNVVFKDFEFNNNTCDGRVNVDFIITSETKHVEGHESEKNTLNLLFELEKSEYGGFDIKGCSVKQ